MYDILASIFKKGYCSSGSSPTSGVIVLVIVPVIVLTEKRRTPQPLSLHVRVHSTLLRVIDVLGIVCAWTRHERFTHDERSMPQVRVSFVQNKRGI